MKRSEAYGEDRMSEPIRESAKGEPPMNLFFFDFVEERIRLLFRRIPPLIKEVPLAFMRFAERGVLYGELYGERIGRLFVGVFISVIELI
mmetsp:Transcript_29125/g.51182  ORF Transcript_29125/g.51182 Transcript_29125/m.51182 type:complete len:90 (-) Transcript_29125:114-383(-)